MRSIGRIGQQAAEDFGCGVKVLDGFEEWRDVEGDAAIDLEPRAFRQCQDTQHGVHTPCHADDVDPDRPVADLESGLPDRLEHGKSPGRIFPRWQRRAGRTVQDLDQASGPLVARPFLPLAVIEKGADRFQMYLAVLPQIQRC